MVPTGLPVINDTSINTFALGALFFELSPQDECLGVGIPGSLPVPGDSPQNHSESQPSRPGVHNRYQV